MRCIVLLGSNVTLCAKGPLRWDDAATAQVRGRNGDSFPQYASTRSPDLAVLLSILPGSAPPPRRPELRGSARLPLKRASMALNRFLLSASSPTSGHGRPPFWERPSRAP
jgi:hypothetical protein